MLFSGLTERWLGRLPVEMHSSGGDGPLRGKDRLNEYLADGGKLNNLSLFGVMATGGA